jgi:peroxiredoxin
MRKIFLAVAAFLPMAVMAQTATKFTVKGKVGNLNTPAKAYFGYQLGSNQVVDSAAITNGAFEFSGDVLFPTNATILIDHKGEGLAKIIQERTADAANFYLDNGTIAITSATDSIAKATIAGSPANDDNNKLKAQMQLINKKAEKIYADAQAVPAAQRQTQAFENSMNAKLKVLQQEQEGVLKDFIKNNPKSFISLIALSSLGGPSGDPVLLETLFNGLDPVVKNTEPAKVLHGMIESAKVTAIGAIAPDFTLPDANGTPVTLSSYKGKYVLIDFWASWCGPCRQENPNVVKAYNKYKTKKFTIIGVSLDKPGAKDAWMSAIKNDGLTWTQVSDLQFWDNKAAKLYGITSIPQNFLLDPTGKIIAKNLRGGDLEAKLAEIFGKI